MGSKRRCPGCGAKNDAAAYRCRICTAVINPDASGREIVEDEVPVAATEAMLADHFDPDEINRQVQPSRARFGAERGGLSARIAAAQGEAVPVRPAGGPPPGVTDATDTVSLDLDAPLMPPPPPASAPIEYDEEPFDPDAIFRDPA